MKASPLSQVGFIIGERLVFLAPQVVVFVLVSRYLGREVFGQYSLVLTWSTLFQIYANFGITECLAREIGREPERASAYFTHGLFLSAGFAVLAMAVMVPVVWAMQYDPDVTLAILLAGGTLFPSGIIGASRGVLLAHRQAEYMTAVAVAENLVLLLNLFWILTGAGLLPIVATIVLAKSLAAVLAFAVVHFRVSPIQLPLQRTLLSQLWRVSLPFGLAAQLPALRFDMFLLSKMTTFATLGLYSAATKIAELLLMFPLAFYLTMLPRVSGDLAEKPEPRTERLTAVLAWYFCLVLPVGVAVIGSAEPILNLVYGSAFVTAAPVLQIQVAAYLLTTVDVIFMMICRATGYQRSDLAIVVFCTASNLLLTVILIPTLGAAGAALAAVLAMFLGMVVRWRLITRSIVRLPWTRLVGPPLAASLLLLPGVLVLQAQAPWMLLAIAYLLCYAAVAVAAFPFVRLEVAKVWSRR